MINPHLTEQLNWRYLFNTRKFATSAAAMAVVALLLLGLVSYPQAQQSLGLYQDWQDQGDEISLLERKIGELEQLPQTPLLQQADVVNQVLPSQKPLLELLSGLNLVAGEAKVRISDFALSPGKIASESATAVGQGSAAGQGAAKGGAKKSDADRSSTASRTRSAGSKSSAYDSIKLELTVTGGLREVTFFLTRVERIAPLTTVSKMALSKEGGALSAQFTEPQFAAKLSVTTYFFTQPVVAAIEAPLPKLSPQQNAALEEITDYVLPVAPAQGRVIEGGGLEDLFGVGVLES